MRLQHTVMVLAALSAGTATAEQGVGWQVGERFPDLLLPSLDGGEPLSVTSFRGQKLILHVFASW